MTDDQGRCRSCNAPIRWVRVTPRDPAKKASAMPVDRAPTPDGNVLICDDPALAAIAAGMIGREVKPGRAVVLNADQRATVTEWPLYVSHFATCPNRQQHRKAPS